MTRNKQRRWVLATFLGVAFVLVFGWDMTEREDVRTAPREEYFEEDLVVTHVIDGDTFDLSDGRRVRLIGIDTPELSYDDGEKDACLAREARDRLDVLVRNRKVRLERDVSDVDAYGRVLRYAYIDEMMINTLLVQEGYAKILTIPPNVRYVDVFQSAQEKARENALGLWSKSCG